MAMETSSWLARVRHDLVKRLLWPARDRRDLGGTPDPGELAPRLIDDEGRPTTPAALWAELSADGPAGADLDRFAAALGRALSAAGADDVGGLLELESAFDDLTRSLERPSQGKP